MTAIRRSITDRLQQDLEEKIVLLAGPRQVGKTFLSNSLVPERTTYLNFDSEKDRSVIQRLAWSRQTDLVVFDEIHKMKNWKRMIKGIYDTEGVRPRLLVTGSARMDITRRGGESLAGRHFLFRLHPFSLKEIHDSTKESPREILDRLLARGGFPEPYLKNSDTMANRWRKNHLDRILREDLLDLENVRDLKSIEILVQLLSERVGSTISYSSLARDLEVSPHTIKRWIGILESLYVIFIVTPYSRNLAKAILKEPKIYFYDTGRVRGDPGARLENLVACALLKRANFLEDTLGMDSSIHYVRDVERREVDFVTLRERKVEFLAEVKWSDSEVAPSLRYFTDRLNPTKSIQLVKDLERPLQIKGIQVERVEDFLLSLET